MLNIEKFLDKYYDINEKIILACSSGPDSMFLFYTIMKTNFKKNLVVCYYDHNLRKESKEEIDFLKKLQNNLGFILEIGEANLKLLQKKSSSVSIEELARQERYNFLHSIRKKYDSNYILTAHHLDDKIETFLFNLLRGSKLTGLINMKEKSGEILRPLIEIQKNDILNFLDTNSLKYKIDESNFTNEYTRNYIRNEILPLFGEVNKSYKKNIKNTIDYLEEIKIYIDNDIKDFLNIENNFFSVKNFKEKNSFFQKEVIRYIFYITNNNSTIGLNSGNIDEVIKYINSKGNKTKKEIKNMKLFKNGDKIIWNN